MQAGKWIVGEESKKGPLEKVVKQEALGIMKMSDAMGQPYKEGCEG